MRWLCSCASGMHLVQVHRLCDHMGTVCVLGCLGVMLSCLIICQNTFRHTRTDVHPHTQSPQGYKQTSNRYIDRERERAIARRDYPLDVRHRWLTQDRGRLPGRAADDAAEARQRRRARCRLCPSGAPVGDRARGRRRGTPGDTRHNLHTVLRSRFGHLYTL